MKNLWEMIRYVALFVGCIYLIENQGDNFISEMAGDVIGAFVLICMGVYMALTTDNEDDVE